MWETLLDVIGQDFAEFRNTHGFIRTSLRLALAAALGATIGIERTVHKRPAGMRTYMLVSLGSASFVVTALGIEIATTDLSRVVQGLMTGVGFLGAGVIIKREGQLQARGLTTAAGLWVTSSVGMACGLGRPATALLTAVLALIILSPLRHIEDQVELQRGLRGRSGGEDKPQA